MSHTTVDHEAQRGINGAARVHLSLIKKVTGDEPSTCPWRSLYDPLVQEVLSVMALDENGNLGVALGQDPPGLLVDAIAHYKSAKLVTQAEDDTLREAKRKQRD